MTEYRIAPYTPPPALVIQGRHGKEIGRLDLTCEPAKFTGDVDESARVLFERVIALHSGRIKELEAERDAALAEKEKTSARPAKGSFEAVFGHLDMTPDEVGNELLSLREQRDALRAVLTSSHMQRVLRFVTNHAGKGLHETLHHSVDWIEKQCLTEQFPRNEST